MLLRTFLMSDEMEMCEIEFCKNYEEAKKCRNSAWEDTSFAKLVLETVIYMCENVPSEFDRAKKIYKNALALLKPLKPQSSVIKLKDAITRKIVD